MNREHDLASHRIQVEQVPTTGPKPDPRNTRTHSRRQVRQIAASIETFGFVNPILIDKADRIIAGHARLEAAEQLGLETVPVIRTCRLLWDRGKDTIGRRTIEKKISELFAVLRPD